MLKPVAFQPILIPEQKAHSAKKNAYEFAKKVLDTIILYEEVVGSVPDPTLEKDLQELRCVKSIFQTG